MAQEKLQWLYNENAEPTIFKGEKAINDALENGWVDTPAKFAETVIEAKVVVKIDDMKKDALLALAIEKGLEFGSKITVPELKELLKEAELKEEK